MELSEISLSVGSELGTPTSFTSSKFGPTTSFAGSESDVGTVAFRIKNDSTPSFSSRNDVGIQASFNDTNYESLRLQHSATRASAFDKVDYRSEYEYDDYKHGVFVETSTNPSLNAIFRQRFEEEKRRWNHGDFTESDSEFEQKFVVSDDKSKIIISDFLFEKYIKEQLGISSIHTRNTMKNLTNIQAQQIFLEHRDYTIDYIKRHFSHQDFIDFCDKKLLSDDFHPKHGGYKFKNGVYIPDARYPRIASYPRGCDSNWYNTTTRQSDFAQLISSFFPDMRDDYYETESVMSYEQLMFKFSVQSLCR